MLKMLVVSLVFMGLSAFPDLPGTASSAALTEENVWVGEVSDAQEQGASAGEVLDGDESLRGEQSGAKEDEAALLAELAAREAELAKREAELSARAAELVKQDKASSASSVELAEREAELAKREAALATREADLVNQDKASVASSAELATREAELAKREAELSARAAELVKQDKASSASSVELAEREAELAKREAELSARAADLLNQDKASVASSAELAERENELAKREAALAEREAGLANQDKVSIASSAELTERETELGKREAALAAREADLVNQDKASVASSAELATREAELAKREAELSARAADLERQNKTSSASSEELASRAADLAAREAALKKEEALLAEKRKADLEAREAELKKKEAELLEKESSLKVKEIALMEKAPVVADAKGIAVPDVNGPGAVIVKKENGLMNWTENYIEATGMAVAPTGTRGAQAKALARRGATLDLQRNLLEFLKGVQIDARTTMNDFMAEDRVRSELSGVIKNVEVMSGEWDGEAYTITGRIKLPPVRAVVAPKIPVDKSYKEPKPKKTAGRFTGLIIDARHLPLVPSMSFRVLDEAGRPVYGMEFVDYDRFLQSGLCAYYNNINYAKGEVHVASNPIVAKAVKLKNGNVDIVIPNSAAAKVRGSSYDFRKDCKVIVVSK